MDLPKKNLKIKKKIFLNQGEKIKNKQTKNRMTLPTKKQENTSLRKRAGPGQLASTERLLWAKGRACLGSSDEGAEVRRVPSPSTGAPLNAGG